MYNEYVKSILITGVSRGIGQATAQVFLENGWQVFGTSTTGKVPFSHTHLVSYKLDISDKESLQNFKKSFGSNKIDVLINNAGIGLDEIGAPPINIDVLRKDLEVNLFGTILVTESVAENINTGGRIINISSMMAALNEDFSYGDPSYRISKAALNMFTLNLAKDPRMVAKDIRVCCFDPGWVQTDMGGSNAPRKPEEPAQELYSLANTDFKTGCFYKGLEIRGW